MLRLRIIAAAHLVVLGLGVAAFTSGTVSGPNITAQAPDLLILEGDTLEIHTNPLEAFFGEDNPRPTAFFPGGCASSSCWRGYKAVWKVIGDGFFLVGIHACCNQDHLSFLLTGKPSCCARNRYSAAALDSLLGGRFKEGKALAQWYSGHVIVRDGALVEAVHLDYASTYEKYIILRVEGGTIVKRWAADLQAFQHFREAQFKLFRETATYAEAAARLRANGQPEEELESFIFDVYTEKYTSMIMVD